MGRIEIIVPKLGLTIEEVEVLRWTKAEGDVVRAGEVVAEVDADKVEMEIEAPADGTVTQILVAEGATAAVGDVLAILEDGQGG